MRFSFLVFDSKTRCYLGFCLSLHIQFDQGPWIVCLSLHIRKCWDIISIPPPLPSPFEKNCTNLVNQYFSSRENYCLTKAWRGGFMTPFHTTSKADFGVLKLPCVLKIFSKPRRVKSSRATGVSRLGVCVCCFVLLRWGWVFLERTRFLSGIKFTTHFIEIFVVETKRFVGSTVNVIWTRQTCGLQRSSRAAQSKRRALGNYFSEWIWNMFLMSKCRGDWDLGLCTFWVLAKREPLRNGVFRKKAYFARRKNRNLALNLRAYAHTRKQTKER